MEIYAVVKTLHILSSTILFGTGMGIAFFMWQANRNADLAARAWATRTTVLADYAFTAPAVIFQPLSGAWLVWQGGYDWLDGWLLVTYALYALAGACWLPVVWIQIRMKRIAAENAVSGQDLPADYFRLARIWFLLGWPAFVSLVIIFFLMVFRRLW